ncbi:MAG TPA: phosphate ABC transporter substrate-binding protein PstS [Candidatus Acidoferrales bacterium]|nr:phosphate ABC transporter substrate-binding protein PstS [Candidatus Acidoferrales bacterium]
MKKTLMVVSLLFAFATVASAQSQVLLNAAGATFPYPIYSKWFSDYHQQHPEIQINYQSIGSGGGIQQLKSGTVDFGASDMPLNDQLLSQFSFKVLQFPTVLGAIVPTYNIPGVTATLKFTPKALADIYLDKVTKWNDPEITSSNPGVNLPGNDIVVVHRSDGSGTTFVFTDFLSKVSPDWKSQVGSNTSVNWPTGLGQKGNEGVSGMVQQTPNAIGYVELIYALQNKMGYGLVQNSSGKFVKASLESVTAAAAGASEKMQSDIRISITDASGADAYPICSFTYLLIPANITDATKRKAIVEFLHWMLSTGQGSVESLNYARLPKAVVGIETKQLSQIK